MSSWQGTTSSQPAQNNALRNIYQQQNQQKQQQVAFLGWETEMLVVDLSSRWTLQRINWRKPQKTTRPTLPPDQGLDKYHTKITTNTRTLPRATTRTRATHVTATRPRQAADSQTEHHHSNHAGAGTRHTQRGTPDRKQRRPSSNPESSSIYSSRKLYSYV